MQWENIYRVKSGIRNGHLDRASPKKWVLINHAKELQEMHRRLKDEVAVFTGAGQEYGMEIAVGFAE